MTSLTVDLSAVTRSVGFCGGIPALVSMVDRGAIARNLTTALTSAIQQAIEGKACLN